MKKVLVVDDEEYLVELLSVNLEVAGFNVVKAYDGEQGLKQTEAERPDIIILDIRMPGVDGFEVCRRLKADPTTKNIPIIMLSAYVQQADINKGLSLGAETYIKKPFDVQNLIDTVNQILKK
jgi:DNA-binding response OmpR family regulator